MEPNECNKNELPTSKTEYRELDETSYAQYFGIGLNELAQNAFFNSVQKFLELSESRRLRLQESLLTKNDEESKFLAHQLKGSLYILGGTKLAEEFESLERLREFDSKSTNHALSLLERMQTFNRELRHFAENYRK